MIKNNYTIAYDSLSTDGKVVTEGLDFQVDIGSAQNINGIKYLIAAYHSPARIGVSNKANYTASFDNLDVRKYFVEIDDQRYPKNAVIKNWVKMIL